MRKLYDGFRYFITHADLFLLFLCLVISIFGVIMIGSATAYLNTTRQVVVQSVAIVLGVILYIFFSVVDVDILAERREVLFVFNFLLIFMLFTPLSVTEGGNRNWFKIPGIPFNIQPSEICKLTFILIVAKTMSVYQSSISKLPTLFRLAFHLAFIVSYLMVASDDAGSALIFILIFIVMLWAGGVHWFYFVLGISGLAVLIPVVWNLQIGGDYVIADYQRQRIMMIFDSSIDPMGSGIRWHTKNSLLTLTNGGLYGQGLFNGTRTQVGALSQQRTDFIFSVVGEELGIVGCVTVMLLLFAIILRIIVVGVRCGNYMNRLICVGMAAMLAWQVIINIGMCVGLTPVIGLTLPFMSYGGSSILSLFAAMGIISGIKMRPAPDSAAHYIRPPY